jgi:hypothetical protein
MNLSHFQSTNTPAHQDRLAELIAPFGVLRFMNWQRTNGSAVAAVGDLPIGISGATGNWSAFSGVPITDCIALANRVGSRPWLCVPHLATAETVRWLVAETLEQAIHRPIFEFSNELWNDIFAQKAAIAPMGGTSHQIEMTRLIKEVAGDSADVVLSGQFWRPEMVIELAERINDPSIFIGVAPYIGGKTRSADYPTIEQIGAVLRGQIASVRTVIDTLVSTIGRCRLVAYEGGLHLVARRDGGAAERRLFRDYNRSADAGEVTAALWESWIELGGGIACPYSAATVYSNEWTGEDAGDFFGHCEAVKDTILPLPKYTAAKRLLGRRCF